MVAVIIIIYLVVQNSHLKEEVDRVKAENDELSEYIDETQKQTINFEAYDPAESFIKGYFNYEDYPKEDDVKDLITEDVKEHLDFGDASQSAGDDEVTSDVEDLDVYYGEATDERQELFAVFNNMITYNGETSEKYSYMKMDMIQEGDEWKLDDFEFRQ